MILLDERNTQDGEATLFSSLFNGFTIKEKGERADIQAYRTVTRKPLKEPRDDSKHTFLASWIAVHRLQPQGESLFTASNRREKGGSADIQAYKILTRKALK